MDTQGLVLIERELKEIQHAIYYVEYCNHGTVGHNMLVLIAKLAAYNGFRNNVTNHLEIPSGVTVVDK